MGKGDRGLPQGLRRKIRAFCSTVMMIVLAVGCLMCGTAIRGMWRYQEAVTQLREIRELKTEVGRVSELLQSCLVGEEDDLPECLRAWSDMSARIYGLKLPSSGTVGLLAEDFKAYQRNTAGDFYRLTGSVGGPEASELYARVLMQQEDRLFLCDLLLSRLSEYLSTHYPILARESGILMGVGSAVFVYLLLVTWVFSRSFSRDIYQPVRMLAAQAEEIMNGNYNMEDLPVIREDEMGYLTQAFNKMKAQIRKHFQDQEELWRLETLLQDAEYRALQSQVNPHFLFNVLGLAMEAALVGDAERTVDVLENISYMLHYSLTSVRENTWLTDELKMVQAYLFLQQRRFGDRVTFSVSFPQEVPALRIPGMTLQPVVENAVKHGVEGMTDGGGVEVLLIRTAEAVELCVRDNGWGIPRERLEALNRGEPVQESGRSTGLGLANVRGRMMMFYGRPDLMRVESVEGEGTSVYLKYLMGEEDFHVPNPDCR